MENQPDTGITELRLDGPKVGDIYNIVTVNSKWGRLTAGNSYYLKVLPGDKQIEFQFHPGSIESVWLRSPIRCHNNMPNLYLEERGDAHSFFVGETVVKITKITPENVNEFPDCMLTFDTSS